MFAALALTAMLCAAPGAGSTEPARGPAVVHRDAGSLELEPPRLGAREDSPPARATVHADVASLQLRPSKPDAREERLHRWERALKWGTAGALVVTSTLGTMAAINQPTAFGDGRCITGRPVLGDYGCDRGLSTLHGAAGVLSATLYTANGVLALALPGPIGNVSPRERPWHTALTYVHLGGIVLQPILGLVSAFPQVIGMHRSTPVDRFPKNLRTIHIGLGYVTTAAYVGTLALEQ